MKSEHWRLPKRRKRRQERLPHDGKVKKGREARRVDSGLKRKTSLLVYFLH